MKILFLILCSSFLLGSCTGKSRLEESFDDATSELSHRSDSLESIKATMAPLFDTILRSTDTARLRVYFDSVAPLIARKQVLLDSVLSVDKSICAHP
jgi:hypothetical protein